MEEQERAIKEIEIYGFTVVKGVLASDEVEAMRKALVRCEQ